MLQFFLINELPARFLKKSLLLSSSFEILKSPHTFHTNSPVTITCAAGLKPLKIPNNDPHTSQMVSNRTYDLTAEETQVTG